MKSPSQDLHTPPLCSVSGFKYSFAHAVPIKIRTWQTGGSIQRIPLGCPAVRYTLLSVGRLRCHDGDQDLRHLQTAFLRCTKYVMRGKANRRGGVMSVRFDGEPCPAYVVPHQILEYTDADLRFFLGTRTYVNFLTTTVQQNNRLRC